MEDGLFRQKTGAVPDTPPVFVTSLPRAGTTALLKFLAHLPGFATHTYRDMPFVMAPLLWDRLSGAFRKRSELAERAHGDGIQVGFDSPEGFEEVIWHAYWPGHYEPAGIQLWTVNDADPDAVGFFWRHFRKVVALRGTAGGAPGRYLSKNNANMGRIDLLQKIFPGATVIVPVRHPLSQAASLLRQHRNFTELHRHNPFVRCYMSDIGHFEFGALHRPLLFPGFRDMSFGLSPDALDYWLAYWIAAFEHVLKRRDAVSLVRFESFVSGDPATILCLCELVETDPSHAARLTKDLRPAPPVSPEALAHRGPLRDRAEALYRELFEGST